MYIILVKGLAADPVQDHHDRVRRGAVLDFVTFVVASAVTRGVRFFLEAGLLMAFGDQARVFIDRRLPWILIATAVLAVLGFGLIRYV